MKVRFQELSNTPTQENKNLNFKGQDQLNLVTGEKEKYYHHNSETDMKVQNISSTSII